MVVTSIHKISKIFIQFSIRQWSSVCPHFICTQVPEETLICGNCTCSPWQNSVFQLGWNLRLSIKQLYSEIVHSFIPKKMDCQRRNKTYLKKAWKSWQWPREQQVLSLIQSKPWYIPRHQYISVFSSATLPKSKLLL